MNALNHKEEEKLPVQNLTHAKPADKQPIFTIKSTLTDDTDTWQGRGSRRKISSVRSPLWSKDDQTSFPRLPTTNAEVRPISKVNSSSIPSIILFRFRNIYSPYKGYIWSYFSFITIFRFVNSAAPAKQLRHLQLIQQSSYTTSAKELLQLRLLQQSNYTSAKELHRPLKQNSYARSFWLCIQSIKLLAIQPSPRSR